MSSIGHGLANAGAAAGIRGMIVDGVLRPGQWLREGALAARLEVSRNTLREAFRALGNDGLVEHVTNRGVRVVLPSEESIVDLYRVRRLVEITPLQQVNGGPAAAPLRSAVDDGIAARASGDVEAVAVADLAFHRAIVALSGSPRLNALYEEIASLLRLAFWSVDDLAAFHGGFVDKNLEITSAFEAGDSTAAAELLSDYLAESERMVLAAARRPAVLPD